MEKKVAISFLFIFLIFPFYCYGDYLLDINDPSVPVLLANEKEDLVLLDKGKEAVLTGVLAGRLFLIQPKTKCICLNEDSEGNASVGEGAIKIMIALGPYMGVKGWVTNASIILEGEDKEETVKPKIKTRGNIPTVLGIFYNRDGSTVIIGQNSYHLNNFVSGGQIIKITPKKITIKFPDGEKDYRVGDSI